jgi:ferredoxin
MKTTLLQNDTTQTAFVHLNIQACTACWKCIETCPNKVIDESFLYIADTLIHSHILMYDASECSGCLNCIDSCKFNAISING